MSKPLPRLHVRRRVDDTESPVSAMLKLNPMSAGLVLFESVMGGESRGRYSFIGLPCQTRIVVRGNVTQVVFQPIQALTAQQTDMASMNPARLLNQEVVRLRRGSLADLVIFRLADTGEKLNIEATIAAGELKFGELASDLVASRS